jgi:phosphate transport system permease protein
MSAMTAVAGARRRHLVNQLMLGACMACAFVCIGVLFAITAYVVIHGIGYLNLDFFTETPKPVGEPHTGVAPAIVGTGLMVGIAALIGIPGGMGIGIFVSEYASPRLGDLVRFVADVMSGIPSVVIGIFIYLVIVLHYGGFSGWAGGLALAMIMLPIVARSSEEMLKLVPNSQREAAYALGIPRWRSIVSVVLPAASRGLITGGLLAISRAAGESAPLIFTALGNRFVSTDLGGPLDALPVRIYRYAISPYNIEHDQAWTAALVLMLFVLSFSILARSVLGKDRS